MFTRPRNHRRRHLTLILGTLALASSMVLSGCYESATDPSDNTVTEAAIDLTLEEVMSKVQISSEQAEALAPLLDTWRQQHRQQKRSRNGQQLVALRMLADASDVLDQGQMLGLMELLREKRQAAFQNGSLCGEGPFGPGPGQGPGAMRERQRGPHAGPAGPGGQGCNHGGPRDGRHGPGAGFLSELGLDEGQQAAVQAAREEMHAAAQTLFEQFRAGSITREELRAAMQPLREAMHTRIEAILTAEQLAQLTELRNARTLSHLETALERLQTNLSDKLPLVARILELDEQQIAAVTALHEDRIAALSAIVESLRTGQTNGEEARDAAQALRAQTMDDFRALLTAEQQEIFDALKSLRHGQHHRGPRR